MDKLASFVKSKEGLAMQNELGDIYVVELTNKNVDDHDLSIFKQPCANEITYLSLNGTQVTDEGISKLASLHRLDDLDLGYTNISGNGFAKLEFESLKKLSLRGCEKLTIIGFKEIIKCRNLEKLNLIESNIDDLFLSEIAKLPKLKTLWADCTKITNDGLPFLNGMTQLISFSSRETAVTREGMLQLLQHLPDLNQEFIM
ncbi:Leucine Rich repeats (2 copies) [Gimesia panareensis]|uniref:Leucine Rich repeats (2 copies) n=1 Tax=Gimesia panareensis TaxID=2527978 RepID=A0A518FT48_9PLAN|nr:hypothetical protein [Gimesia panareensis]QDV19526.1 Leucine Rich repeats (2 copies) [Gimesia panareensis]